MKWKPNYSTFQSRRLYIVLTFFLNMEKKFFFFSRKTTITLSRKTSLKKESPILRILVLFLETEYSETKAPAEYE